MRKIMMAAVGLVMSGGVAWGQSASQDISLTANVGSYCTISNGANVGVVNLNTLGLINNQKANANLSSILPSTAGGAVQCTSNAKVLLESMSGGLTNSENAGSVSQLNNFTNKIHYTATANYNGVQASIDTSTYSGTGMSRVFNEVTTTDGATLAGTLSLGLTIQATATSKTLVGGNYADTLKVTLTPTL